MTATTISPIGLVNSINALPTALTTVNKDVKTLIIAVKPVISFGIDPINNRRTPANPVVAAVIAANIAIFFFVDSDKLLNQSASFVSHSVAFLIIGISALPSAI